MVDARKIEDLSAQAGKEPIGVLLVHGIGEQERGDTLLHFGEPLYKWMNAWANCDPFPDLNGHNNVRLKDTSILRPLRPSLDAPPYMLMDLSWNDGCDTITQRGANTEPDHKATFLIAESWWAKDIRPVGFRQLVLWGVAYAPWVFELFADRRWRLARRDLRELRRERSRTTLASAAFGLFTAAVLMPLAIVVSFLFQTAVLALLLLAVVPALRGLIARLQATIAGAFGDPYLLVTSPVSFDAMVSQVQRDLDWLVDGGKCSRIAVLAHSQGAAVAYEALREEKVEQVHRFVTFGNPFRKLTLLRRATRDQDRYGRRAVIRLAGITLFWLGIALSLISGELSSLLVMAAGGLTFLLAHQYRVPDLGELEAADLALPHQEALDDWAWCDYWASADPVPDGPIFRSEDEEGSAVPPGHGIVSTKIRNRDSVFSDHTTYWQNAEQFVAPIARTLVGLAGLEFLPRQAADAALLEEASRRREARIDALRWAGWLAFAAVPISIAALWGEPLTDITRWLGDALNPVWVWLSELLNITLPLDGPLAAWIGAVLVILVAWGYRVAVIAPLWRRWDLCLAEQLFHREWQSWRSARMRTFVVAAAVPPIATGIAVGYGRTTWAGWLTAALLAGLAIWLTLIQPVRSMAGVKVETPADSGGPAEEPVPETMATAEA
jgi:hypothetical protein